MSYVTLPDPDPGRCKNHRPSTDAWSNPTSVRCLGYESDMHVCVFPDPPQRLPPNWGANATLYTAREPKPWVSPLTASVSPPTQEPL